MPTITRAFGQIRVGPGQNQLVVSNRETLIVTGILFSATQNASVVLLSANDFTVLATIRLLANTSFEMRSPFPAANGLAVTTDANSECTIFYTILRAL